MHCYHLVRIYMHCCCFVRIYMLCLEKIYSICCRFFAYLMVDLRCYIQPRAISFAVKILKGERNKERTCIMYSYARPIERYSRDTFIEKVNKVCYLFGRSKY